MFPFFRVNAVVDSRYLDVNYLNALRLMELEKDDCVVRPISKKVMLLRAFGFSNFGFHKQYGIWYIII